MKNADEAIAKVMAGLRQAEAAPGFEERVAAGVRRRTARDVPSGSIGLRWLGLALGSVAALMLTVAVGTRRAEKRSHSWTTVAADPLRPGSAMPLKDHVQEKSVDQRVPVQIEPRSKPRFQNGRSEAKSFNRTMRGQSSSASTSALVSYPAPPLPLTEQERLLLRVLHRGEPELVARLDATVRAAEEAQDATEYLDFFGRAVPPEPTKPGGGK